MFPSSNFSAANGGSDFSEAQFESQTNHLDGTSGLAEASFSYSRGLTAGEILNSPERLEVTLKGEASSPGTGDEDALDIDNPSAAVNSGPSAGITQVTALAPDALAEAAEVYVECFTSPPWNESWTIAEAEQTIQKYLQNGADVFVADLNGSIVGLSVGMDMGGLADAAQFPNYRSGDSQYYIADIVVSSSAQGLGLGKKLLGQLEAAAWAGGASELITRTKVNNKVASSMFLKYGFEECFEQTFVTGNTPSLRTVFKKGPTP